MISSFQEISRGEESFFRGDYIVSVVFELFCVHFGRKFTEFIFQVFVFFYDLHYWFSFDIFFLSDCFLLKLEVVRRIDTSSVNA